MADTNLITNYKHFDGRLKDIIGENENVTFFCGAGISIDPPSNLLPASEFTRNLLNFAVAESEIDNLIRFPTLRFEIIIEIIHRYFAPLFEFMDYFDLFKTPNLIHLFLAESIINKNIVFTTNFDYLIEYALLKTTTESEKDKIKAIITLKDYENNPDPEELINKGYYALYKLHGSKQNVLLNMKTQQSLKTSLSSFAKGDDVLTLHPLKREAISNSIKDHTLIVLGYSGGDDFDIGPILRKLFDLKKIIWIEHTQNAEPEIIQFVADKCHVIDKTLSRSEKLLAHLCSNSEAEVYMIKTNTLKYVRNVLFDILYPDSIPKIYKLIKKRVADAEPPISFDLWLNKTFNKIPEVLKWKITCDIYYELGYYGDFYRCAQLGLKAAEEAGSAKIRAEFYNLIGLYKYREKDYDGALKNYEQSLELIEASGSRFLKGSCLNNIGTVYLDKGDFVTALKYFNLSHKYHLENGNHNGMASTQHNIGLVQMAKGNYDEAMDYLNRAMNNDKKAGNLLGRAKRLKVIGDIYKKKKDYVKALESYRESYRIVQKIGDLVFISDVLIELAELQNETGDFGRAISNVKMAIKYLKSSEYKSLLAEAEDLLNEIKKNLK